MIYALWAIAVCLAVIAVEGFILLSRVTGVSLKLRLPYRVKDTEESKMNGVSRVGIKL
jgi:hypothetical protein